MLPMTRYFRKTQSRNARQVKPVSRTGDMRNAYNISVDKFKEENFI
jgi:hypothetical protein